MFSNILLFYLEVVRVFLEYRIRTLGGVLDNVWNLGYEVRGIWVFN